MKQLHWFLGVVACAAVMGSVADARAEGFELGARLGYGIPMGKGSDQGTNTQLSSAISGMVPLQLDVGYRVVPNLMVGGYLMYGFGINGDNLKKLCDSGSSSPSCSIHDLRLGLQAHYHFTPDEKVDPWIGAGLGYEWLGLGIEQTFNGATTKASTSVHGWEFINLQGGADFSLAPGFGLGPFASLSVAQYGTASNDCSGAGCADADTSSQDIDKKAIHEWLILGVRGDFVL